ncbi:LTA synthase family protein [Bacillaceae bacterium SIJ1]|uniref:LTA synthase family protein n=1 Tax=Litoribacterium kuwaitense TaxID=1398745 RepID=UPI0013ECF07C|nr:LTA synthase family protein [Litoribacterium kuwaitense]NGP44960.1 LTA synthase family protein [Litoribacterium kuwaitense]
MGMPRTERTNEAWTAWPFFWFTFVLLAKLIFIRSTLFSQVNILQSVWVEIGYVLAILGMVAMIRWRPVKWTLFVIVNLIMSVFLFSVVVYYNYSGYIVTYHALSQINQVGTVGDSVASLIRPEYFLLFIDFVLLPIIILIIRSANKRTDLLQTSTSRWFWLIPATGIVIIAINLTTYSNQFIPDTAVAAEKQGLITYEVLAFADGSSELALAIENKEEMIETIQEIKDPQQAFASYNASPEERNLFGAAEGRHIFVLQLEAFQQFALGLEVDGKPVTPFLNDLLKESFHFPNFYQQVGQGNTSDAEFLLNTSIYPPAFQAASETYSNKDLPSLPKLLKRQQNYQTLTFHANDVSFWSRNDMYPALGFDEYYDISFFGDEDVIGIGPSDDVLYSKAMPELVKKADNGQPIYANFITLSSHHPFRIPQSKKPMEMPEDIQGTIVEDYLQSIHYTDQMIGKFVEQLKANGLWENSLLVMYGDHFGLQQKAIEQKDIEAIDHLLDRPYTDVDRFNIPLIMTAPGITDGQTIELTGGQIDIFPTIANLVGLHTDQHVMFGQDLLNTSSNLLGMRYYMPLGSFFNDEIMFRPEESFADGEAYRLETTEEMTDFAEYKSDYERILQLLQLSDAYADSLPEQQ